MLFTALIPVILIVMLGYGFSRSPLSTPSMWGDMERLTYYLFFPCMLVTRLSQTIYDGPLLLRVGAALAVSLAIMTVIVVAVRPFIGRMPGAVSSMFQGSIRFNTYVGLAVVNALYGEQGLIVAALCIAVYIPLVNALSLGALVLDSRRSSVGLMQVPGAIIMNPLVLASLLGLAISFSGINLPALIWEALDVLGQPALPLGLLAMGGSIKLTKMNAQKRQLMLAVFSKLLLFPLLVLFVGVALNLDSGLISVLILLACLPAPPSVLILAAQTGGNVGLSANIITVQTLATAVTLPLWVLVAGLL